ncbi:DUF4912 domain-containing protein [Clostridium botulinum]|uniref:DUF4912 domain-containing protein n=1 Tax=Clostridium botulinum TaxID=1491 RepID=UPI0005D1E5E9
MNLLHYENSYIVLMPKSTNVVFCYYNISSMTIKDFENIYGEDIWKNSKGVLKVYEVDHGINKEIKTIYIDIFADNWYINLDKFNINVFVKLGRILPNDKFVSIAISNTVITPRNCQSDNTDIFYIDISKECKEYIGEGSLTYDDKCDLKKNTIQIY